MKKQFRFKLEYGKEMIVLFVVETEIVLDSEYQTAYIPDSAYWQSTRQGKNCSSFTPLPAPTTRIFFPCMLWTQLQSEKHSWTVGKCCCNTCIWKFSRSTLKHIGIPCFNPVIVWKTGRLLYFIIHHQQKTCHRFYSLMLFISKNCIPFHFCLQILRSEL